MPGPLGIFGGDDNPDVTADDFNVLLLVNNGRLLGYVTGLVESHEECPDGPESCQTVTGPAPATSYDLPYEFPEGDCSEIGVCTVTDGRMGRSGTTTNLIGTAVIKPGFWGYQLIPGHYSEGFKIIDQTEPMLMFGGTAYEFGTPSGRLFTFDLTSDVLQDSAIGPFGLNGSSPSVDPNKPLPEISPLAYLESDGDQNNAVWLQTSFYIKTTYNSGESGEDPALGIAQQDSYINVALGGVDPESGGLVGQRRGGSHIGVPIISSISNCDGECLVNEVPPRAQEAYAFSGNVATLGGPDGSHFLGDENPNFAIGFDSTGDSRHRPEHAAHSRQPDARAEIRLGLSHRHRQERLPNADADPVGSLFRLRRPEWCNRRYQLPISRTRSPAPRPTISRSISILAPTR